MQPHRFPSVLKCSRYHGTQTWKRHERAFCRTTRGFTNLRTLAINGYIGYRNGHCCLTACSHYLKKFWLDITKVQRHFSDSKFTRIPQSWLVHYVLHVLQLTDVPPFIANSKEQLIVNLMSCVERVYAMKRPTQKQINDYRGRMPTNTNYCNAIGLLTSQHGHNYYAAIGTVP